MILVTVRMSLASLVICTLVSCPSFPLGYAQVRHEAAQQCSYEVTSVPKEEPRIFATQLLWVE